MSLVGEFANYSASQPGKGPFSHSTSALKAVRYHSESRTIVQRTKIGGELADLLKKFGIPIPKQLLAVTDSTETQAAA